MLQKNVGKGKQITDLPNDFKRNNLVCGVGGQRIISNGNGNSNSNCNCNNNGSNYCTRATATTFECATRGTEGTC